MCARRKIACFALTEPDVGTAPVVLQTTAVPRNGGYVLHGRKIFTTNGGEAQVVVVFATVEPSLEYRGINEFVVEKGISGFSVGKKLGIGSSSTLELVFESCWIPESNLIGERNRGFYQAWEAIQGNRVLIAAQAVGIAQATFETVKQLGPLPNFQADMATQIDAARFLTYRAAWLKTQGHPFLKEVIFATEMSRQVTNKALQVLEDYGYIEDYRPERYFRDAKMTEVFARSLGGLSPPLHVST